MFTPSPLIHFLYFVFYDAASVPLDLRLIPSLCSTWLLYPSSSANYLSCCLHCQSVCVCVFLMYTCPCIVPEKKPSYVTWASTAQGSRGGWDGGGCGGTVFVTLGVFVDFGVKDSLVFAILSSAGFTLWGKPPLLSFYSKFRPLAHSFACYSVFALSCMASALLAATRRDLLESCHDNFCLHLMSETRGDWFKHSRASMFVYVCLCACVSVSVCERTGCGKALQLKK